MLEKKQLYKCKMKKRGITMISLVITIIILIILAAISLNGLFGENGLITRTKEAAEMSEISNIQEQLEIAKGQAYIEGKGHIDPDRYFEIIEEEGIIRDKDEDVKKIEEEVYEITTEKRIYI